MAGPAGMLGESRADKMTYVFRKLIASRGIKKIHKIFRIMGAIFFKLVKGITFFERE